MTDSIRTSVTSDGCKLNYSPRGEHELYNLFKDPGETENLFDREENKPILDKLVDQIVQWQKRTADSVELPTVRR